MIARAVVAALLATAAVAAPLQPPPAPPKKPVTETLFGTTLVDAYRYMEDEKDTSVTDWMKAEGRYTRGVLDSIPGRKALAGRIAAFTASTDVIDSVQRFGGRVFYQERTPGSDNLDLLVRQPDGTARKLVDVAALRAANGGKPFAINYFSPSPDGTKVAVGISEGGSENASIEVLDTATGKRVAGPLAEGRFGILSWSGDSRSILTNLLNKAGASDAAVDRFKNSKIYAWNLKDAPVPVLGNGVPGPMKFQPDEIPAIDLLLGSPEAFAANINGVQNEVELWTAPQAAALKPGTPWQKFVDRSDEVTKYATTGKRIFLLSHKGAPTFQILALDAGQPVSAAKVVVAAKPDRLIESIAAASDGLYVSARHGVYSELFKVPLAGGAEIPIALPQKGSIGSVFTDPRTPGALVTFESWTIWPTTLSYGADGKYADLKLGYGPKGYDATKVEVLDLQAKARDGVAVPMSYVRGKGPGPRPLILDAYGSYGISQFPGFATRMNFAVAEGIDYATCHVRGGGELGDAWRLAGKDANKPNTWRDLIACAEDAIARGLTTKDKLFIMGGSAGGITMGRAMEERPDLFAGVFDMVPAANAVRQEFSPNGPMNTPEFGTVANEQGFRNLLAMDSYYNVKDGTQYPPIMITTGLNDPRVSSWEPAKLTARLRDAGTKAPVLLRVDEDAGHGIGSTKTQNDLLYADIVAFAKWRSGAPGWAPAAYKAK